jgi:hypothetical protein
VRRERADEARRVDAREARRDLARDLALLDGAATLGRLLALPFRVGRLVLLEQDLAVRILEAVRDRLALLELVDLLLGPVLGLLRQDQ